MKGDFQKFKDMLEKAEKNMGPLSRGLRVALIIGSPEGQHLVSYEEAEHIVKQIEEDKT